MANGTSGQGGRRPDPSASTTREEAVNAWGRSLAMKTLKGESILQNRHDLPHPRTLPSVETSASGQARRVAPNRFHGMNSLILRTVSVQRGLKDPTFSTERAAVRFNAMHGDVDKTGRPVRPVQARATRIEVPNAASNADEVRRTYRNVTLAKDGNPNHNEFGEKVRGKKGDVARDENGAIRRELVEVEGSRRAAGVRVYFHRDDLNVPHLQPRERPTEQNREYLLANTVGKNRRFEGLEVNESAELAGRAELVMQPAGTKVGDQTLEKDTYRINIGPEASFTSVDHHRSAMIHELSRFSMCRDGNADALAVAKADPAKREKMPEFARSELAASAATLENVTAVGHTWHPPTYTQENRAAIRQTQADYLREDGSLPEIGRQAHRVERMNQGQEPTARDQAQRNYDRRQQAPSVEAAAQGFATRGARPMQRAAAVPAAGEAAPAKGLRSRTGRTSRRPRPRRSRPGRRAGPPRRRRTPSRR